jgi:hypothetical protein
MSRAPCHWKSVAQRPREPARLRFSRRCRAGWGVLSVMQKEKWYDPCASLDEWVEKNTGMKRSKARALIQIYNAVADSGITWAQVKHIKWTKLRAIARVLSLPRRVGREGARLQEDARTQLGLPRSGRVALPLAFVARADARAGAGEAADRHPLAGPNHGPVHGTRGRLVDARGKSLTKSRLAARQSHRRGA